jgi:hypothetical protein
MAQKDLQDDYEEERLRNRVIQPEPVEQAPSEAPVPPAEFPAPSEYQAPVNYQAPQADAQAPAPQYNLPAPGTPVYGEGGVFNQDQGTVNAPYNNAPAPATGGANPTQWSRPFEDQWINFVRTQYGGTANVPLQDIVARYNQTFGANARVVGADKVDFGFGPADVIKDVGGRNELWLGDYPDPNRVSPNSGGGGAPAPTGGGNQFGVGAPMPRSNSLASFAGFGGGASSNAPGGIWGADYLAQLRQLLMQRLQAAGGPVDENAAGITDALTGARNEATRMTDKERTELAERLYAQGGLNTDAISQQVQQSGERNATALGSLRGKLIMQEYQAKREELRSLLALALQSSDAESARAIQAQLAELEATLRREGYGVQMAAITANQNANANTSLFD